MTADELRAKFEAWWNFLLQTPNATAYSSGLPADGDYQGFSWLAFQAAHASRDAEVEASLSLAYEGGRASREAEVEALKRDAEIGRYVLKYAEWIRDEDETLMAIRFAGYVDLSSVGTRRDAIEALIGLFHE